jgi:hypothetical protein
VVGLAAAPQSRAALMPVTPVGDDTGFLAFGAVAEGVLAAFFAAALTVRGAWSSTERRLLEDAHDAHRANVDRLNTVLGPDDAIALDAFSRDVRVGSRAGALKVGRRLEAVVGGAYLSGVSASTDPGSRLLLGRLLAMTAGNNALLAHLAGGALPGLPSPVELESAGRTIDIYVTDPT